MAWKSGRVNFLTNLRSGCNINDFSFSKNLLVFYISFFDISLICARTSRAAKKYPTNMLVMEIIEMSSIFKCCHIFRTVQSPSAHNTFTSMFLQNVFLSCVFFKCSDRLHFFFLGPTAYTCSHIDHMRKVFLHFGFACVIWVSEPVCRKMLHWLQE